MRWAEIVMLGDNTLHLREMDVWRRDREAKIVGATQASAAWELDRTLGQQVFKRAGIATPPFREFTNYDEAIRYVEKEGKAFVSKPLGDEENKSLSYVPHNAADLIYMLRRWKKSAKSYKSAFILQEKVKGVEMAVGAWVGPQGFIGGFTENFEFKKLMVGDLGPNTGEMGTAVAVRARSKLAEKVLLPLEEAIVETGHTGYIDVNCIVSEDGTPWPLEFTTRFGYPTWPIQQQLVEGDPAEWLLDLVDGRDARPFNMHDVAIGVVLANGDFPFSHMTKREVTHIPLYGASPTVMERLNFNEMMVGTAPHQVGERVEDRQCYVSAGDYLMVCTGLGPTVSEARQDAYRLVRRLSMPASPFYRTDIGLKLKECLPKVQELGYARDWRYV